MEGQAAPAAWGAPRAVPGSWLFPCAPTAGAKGPEALGVALPLAKARHGEGVPRLLSRPSAGGLLAQPPGCRSQGRPIPSGLRERCLLRRGVLVLWQRHGWSQGSVNKASIPGAGAQPWGWLGAAFPAGPSSPVCWDPGALCLPLWPHVVVVTPCKAHSLGASGMAGASFPRVPGCPLLKGSMCPWP